MNEKTMECIEMMSIHLILAFFCSNEKNRAQKLAKSKLSPKFAVAQ